jgi:XTP/dITP diphosphohydrolase
VRSARYAGEGASDGENLAKLIEHAPAGSALRYVCVIAFVDPASGEELTFEGTLAGTMAAAPAGSGGFGYDPVFLPEGGDGQTTVAELDDAEKDAISHRGRAARLLAARLVT